MVNFIKHFVNTVDKFESDKRLTPFHVSLYVALFSTWNENHFESPLPIHRADIMRLSKIGSVNTYIRCLNDLHRWHYVIYRPSYSKHRPSTVHLRRFDIKSDVNYPALMDDAAVDENESPASAVMPGMDDHEHGRNGDSTHREESRKTDKGSAIGCSKGSGKGYGKGADHGGDPNSIKTDKGADNGSDQEVRPLYINLLNNTNNTKQTNAYEPANENSDLCNGGQPHQNTQAARAGSDHRKQKTVGGRAGGAIPESLEEAQAHFLKERSTAREAEKFFNHYQSNGWRIGGRAPMKDWKAAARNWLINAAEFAQERSNVPRPGHLHTDQNKNYAEPL